MYHLNFNSAVPLYEQIEKQTQFLIASGALREDKIIPSVREVSKRFAINPLTVSRAYTNLKNQGLIRPLRGLGYVVTSGARRKCRRARLEFFQTLIEDALAEAALGKLSIDDMREIIDSALQKTIEKYYSESKGDRS